MTRSLQLGEHLRDGVPFATPVFDGAAEKEIHAMLDLAYPEEIAKRLQLTAHRRRRRGCSTDAPATPSSARSRSATCTC